LDLEEALIRLYEAIPSVTGTQTLTLAQARGHILADTISAPLNLPPFEASAMDGYALRGADFSANPDGAFRIQGESLAGHPYPDALAPGQCMRIFTGAKVPVGADQVLLQEEVLARDAEQVTFKAHTPTESYVRPIGHDVSIGTPLAEKGTYLDALTLGALAAAGVDTLSVFKLPKVGVFSTGDELVDPGTPVAELAEGQIYDSNRFTVIHLLADTPCEVLDLGRLADDPEEVEAAFREASKHCQILVTSGGVSVGDADFITSTIEQLGSLEFWRLNLKPGKPLAFGRIDDCYVFGLPGNPVSTIVTLLLLARPAICHCAGTTPAATLRVSASLLDHVQHTPGRAEYQRGQYTSVSGQLNVTITGDQSSNRLRSFRDANCLVEIPSDAGNVAPGTTVTILPFRGLLS
jgi:molybdopterin molybdotransferase